SSIRICAYIGNARRYGFQRGTEGGAEAQCVNVEIEVERRFVGRQHAVETDNMPAELLEHLRSLEQNPRAAVLQERGITKDLNRVAETLLGSYQQGLAFKLLAVPHRLTVLRTFESLFVKQPAEFV